jgi:hypothetical protein
MYYTLVGQQVVGALSPTETQHILSSSLQRLDHTRDSIGGMRERVQATLARIRQSEARISASDGIISSAESLGGRLRPACSNEAALREGIESCKTA